MNLTVKTRLEEYGYYEVRIPMKSVFYLLDTAPYGSEKAFGALNAAAVSLNRMQVTLGLYGDGIYLIAAGQDSRKLGVPNLSDILYSYGELRVLVHEPSLFERGLFGENLIETVELVDEEDFFESMENSDCVIRF